MQPREIAAAAARELAAAGPVGCAIGLRRADGSYGEAAAGFADLMLKKPMTPDRQFRIASISKTFVFALVLRLAEEGRLSLDEPIARFVPDLPYAGLVTLRHILTQTGGLPVWATDRLSEIPKAAGWSPADVIAFHYEKTRPQMPGGPMVYANVGSRLAGLIAEKAAGLPIATLMRRRFLDPLALADTVPSGAGAVRPQHMVIGYDAVATGGPADVTYAVPHEWLWAGGDMVSTVADLTRWAQALFGGKVLGPDMTRALYGPWAPGGFHGSTMSHHGLGIMVFSRNGIHALGYRGTTPGFVSALGYDPKTRAAVAVLTNSFASDPNSIHRSGVEAAMFGVLEAVRGLS